MSREKFVYVIYIAASAETVWDALLRGELTRQYWGHENVSDWKRGSAWKHITSDDQRKVRIEGQVLEADPPRRLVLTWAEPGGGAGSKSASRVTLTIEPLKDMVRLTVFHEELGPEMFESVSAGWPRVLSSLKSLLERGRALETWS